VNDDHHIPRRRPVFCTNREAAKVVPRGETGVPEQILDRATGQLFNHDAGRAKGHVDDIAI
jgi:hypothetical protein